MTDLNFYYQHRGRSIPRSNSPPIHTPSVRRIHRHPAITTPVSSASLGSSRLQNSFHSQNLYTSGTGFSSAHFHSCRSGYGDTSKTRRKAYQGAQSGVFFPSFSRSCGVRKRPCSSRRIYVLGWKAASVRSFSLSSDLSQRASCRLEMRRFWRVISRANWLMRDEGLVLVMTCWRAFGSLAFQEISHAIQTLFSYLHINCDSHGRELADCSALLS
jgi:hypothetical protein